MSENGINFIGSYLPIFLLGVLVCVKWLYDVMFGDGKETSPKDDPAVYTGAIPQDGKGIVYLIRDKDVTGLIKIGRTFHANRRLGQFRIDLPFKTEVVHIIETDNCIALETSLHRLCANKRVRGEWFALDDDDIAAIRRLA